MKALYLRIYLTVLAVLLAFALVTGWLAHYHLEHEREQMRAVWVERANNFAALIGNSLPDAQTPVEEQERALLDWSRRLHVPLALDDAQGRAIASSPELSHMDTASREAELTRGTLPDGRVIWVARPSPLRGNFGPDHPGPRFDGPPGPPPGERRGPPPGELDRGARDPGPGFDRPERHADQPGMPRHDDHPPGMDKPPRRDSMRWWAGPWGLLFNGPNPGMSLIVAMGVLFVAVAVGALPLVRSLTRRLEALKQGVDRFGQGQLSHRVAVDGRDEVAAVASSFNDAAQRIEELVHSHRALLANASHELRSPLARLKMALVLMDGASPERQRTLRDEVDHDIRELDALVDEVLLSSRLDARPDLARDPIDVPALAAEEAGRVDAHLAIGPSASEARMRGDERLVRRALRNLLENARRYGVPEHGGAPIELQVELMPAGAATQVVFKVCDRGPGVAPDQRERIFEPFYRVPGHAEHAGGVGLGLALVKQIAERHGGSVRCEERLGGGSCFVLSLPTAA